ncbi:MAG: AAA family ATPase [Bacteroides sp.]|nr:AAA family ATPase [Bacteroides sp.]
MAAFTLTKSQQSAVDVFRAFLKDTSQVLMLKGAAGTGKTTLVAEFLTIIANDKRGVTLMAPTGRAAYIIGNKTNRIATTIHKAIYALSNLSSISQNKESDDDGGLHARFAIRYNDDPESTVYIVDEASMVSDAFSENEAFSFGSGRLLTDLFEFARGRKIVFVGDYAQLPPVGMNFSPALDKDYVEQTFDCKVTEIMLREVMRQKSGSVMLSNANKIRDCIEAKTFIEFSLQKGDDSLPEDTDLLRPYYALSDTKPDRRSAIITYSNRQALQYNLAVRRHYFGEDAPRLMSGDLLMIARNNYAYEYELFNGNVVMVDSCASDNDMETRLVKVKLSKNRIENVELRFRKAVLRFNAGGKAASINVRLLDNFLDDPNGALGGLIARALVVDFEKRLPNYIKDRLPQLRKMFRNHEKLTIGDQEIYNSYLKSLLVDPYYNAVVCKYGYAMTCHKAQGGEWDNVFVDMCRYGGTSNEDYFRWAYTAITRASKKLWHYRSPDFNYISNIVVEPIQSSANIKVSTYSEGIDFCDARFSRIEALARNAGLSVSEDKSRQSQHWVTFTDNDGNSAVFILWYKNKGYSNKDGVHKFTNNEFAALCGQIVDKSYAPVSVPFSAPARPFAEKLVDYVKSQLKELDIQLLNITQEQFQDVFHLKTDGIAKVGLYYTDKGNYTYMKPISSLGSEDTKLEAFRQRFI